jgi:penicillin-binding protein 2
MSESRPDRRLPVIVALVASLFATLFARLYFVQIADPNKPVQTANLLRLEPITVPAPRGLIVDSTGKALVDNTATQVLTVDRQTVQGQPDHGVAVLRRLGALLHLDPVLLGKEIRTCSPSVPAPCFTGEPYQPVPISASVPYSVVLAISEHREQFPGVQLSTQTLLHYPGGSLAAHLLGYTSQVTEADKKANPNLVDADTIGVSGLEAQYDSVLRGSDGKDYVELDPQGDVVGNGPSVAAAQGDTLVTSIDGKLQQLAEQSLAKQIADSRKSGYAATSGAVVALDPNTGRVLAVASYPTYDPAQFVGGISNADYARLIAPSSNDPLLDRAIGGQYAPGSTFKLITTSSLVSHNEISLDGIYGCPGSVSIDGRVKTNYDSEVLGNINLENALGYSCDTFFYVPEANEYFADQALVDAGKKPNEYLQHMAASYGVGQIPGIDLPADEQATGSYADRETRMARWKANKAQYCKDAQTGFPNDPNPADRAYLTELAKENCTDGWRYRAGDNADMAIGQGETTVSPLQLAVAYSALVNGGKIFEPTIGWQVVNGHGKVVKTIKAKVRDRVPVAQSTLNYIKASLSFSRGWAVSGAFAYLHSPYQNLLGGKTGTAEVYGHQDTSWLASWGPVTTDAHGNIGAKMVLVGMVEQAGTGARGAGPMLKRIWDGVFGAGTQQVLPNAAPVSKPPKISAQVRVSNAAGPAVLPTPTATTSNPASPTPSGPAPAVITPNPTPDAVPTPSPRVVRSSP